MEDINAKLDKMALEIRELRNIIIETRRNTHLTQKLLLKNNEYNSCDDLYVINTSFGELVFYANAGSMETHGLLEGFIEINEKNNKDDSYNFNDIDFKDGDVVIDIGANVGAISIYLAKKYPFIKVYSFEPIPRIYQNLVKNIEANNLTNITPINKAVTSDGRPVEMIYSLGVNLASCITENMHEKHIKFINHHGIADKLKIESISLNDIFDEFNIDKCKLLKIDCEGSEEEVLVNTNVLSKIEHLRGEIHYEKERTMELLNYLVKHINPENMKFCYLQIKEKICIPNKSEAVV